MRLLYKIAIIFTLAILLGTSGCLKKSMEYSANVADGISIKLTDAAPWSKNYGPIEFKVETSQTVQ